MIDHFVLLGIVLSIHEKRVLPVVQYELQEVEEVATIHDDPIPILACREAVLKAVWMMNVVSSCVC